MIKISLTIAFLLFSQLSYGLPSWCTRASLPVEKLICSDHDLASVDKELNDVYLGLRFELTSDKRQDVLEVEQRAWLTKRNREECEKTCLIAMYRKRIDELTPTNRRIDSRYWGRESSTYLFDLSQ